MSASIEPEFASNKTVFLDHELSFTTLHVWLFTNDWHEGPKGTGTTREFCSTGSAIDF